MLGYYPVDNSEIPDIPSSCLALITTLVDDLSHSQTRTSRLELDLDECSNNTRNLNIQVISSFNMKLNGGSWEVSS